MPRTELLDNEPARREVGGGLSTPPPLELDTGLYSSDDD